MSRFSLFLAACAAISGAVAQADPCGMVPPIYIGDGVPIVRTGDQQTYVFYQDGVETFIIRPGFSGKVEEFGMLIPFPSPPALRKVPETVFAQIQAAVDPPEVVIDVRYQYELAKARFNSPKSEKSGAANYGLALRQDEVRVLKEEAVGMYEVAVLEAGSAAALKKWMDDHGFKYPDGMDDVCEEYVKLGWCFVAEKARVGGKSNLDPKPDMRDVDTKLPAGAAFDGHVQAMGFRFKSDKLVVPMRLGTYNDGDLHNIVYLLTDKPQKVRSIPEEYVVRQIAGKDLFRNLTEPLPLRIIGGTESDIPEWQRTNLPQQRDPAPHNGVAKDVFASDLLAIAKDRLSHPFEENEKQLLRIGEHFSMRGPEIDKLNLDSLAADRQKASDEALADVKNMTLTVIDGDFPREVLSSQNLVFGDYKMPARRNKAEFYDAKTKQPAGKQEGVLKLGALSPREPVQRVGQSGISHAWPRLLAVIGFGAAIALLWGTGRGKKG